MSFQDALQSNSPAPLLGDVRLSYEHSTLVGESRALPPDTVATALLLGAATTGIAAVALLAFVPAATSANRGATLLGATAAALLWLSQRLTRAGRVRRRFVLHFATEELRLEASPRPTAPRARTQIVPFRDVQAVALESSSRGHLLRVTWMTDNGPSESAVLVDRIGDTELPMARRLEQTLKAALGSGGSTHPGARPTSSEIQ